MSETSTDGGVTVVQRRVDGSVDFNQTWKKYEQGFGDLESEYNLASAKTLTAGFLLNNNVCIDLCLKYTTTEKATLSRKYKNPMVTDVPDIGFS